VALTEEQATGSAEGEATKKTAEEEKEKQEPRAPLTAKPPQGGLNRRSVNSGRRSEMRIFRSLDEQAEGGGSDDSDVLRESNDSINSGSEIPSARRSTQTQGVPRAVGRRESNATAAGLGVRAPPNRQRAAAKRNKPSRGSPGSANRPTSSDSDDHRGNNNRKGHASRDVAPEIQQQESPTKRNNV
jgi:hypothetical protein